MFIDYFVIFSTCMFIQISNGKIVDDLVVQLVKPSGKIRGHVLESAQGREYFAFQQIPYAQPPVGEYRFRAPEMHADWNETLDCTKNTIICYQFHKNSIGYSDQESISNEAQSNGMKQSEDCLHLNVYTPVKPGSNNSLSVFIFVHGGSFVSGDGTFSTYGPKYLIDGDIVIVTLNYRLGPFGFLSTGDSIISGNMGLKDQHLALKWTYDNIHLFGGNPEDIILGGESAGSHCVGYHQLSPRTKGLVSGFVQQSGSHLSVAAVSLEPRKYAFELGRVLDSAISNVSSLVYTLMKASAEDLVKASSLISSPIPFGLMAGMTWTAVIEDVDSPQAFLTSPMYDEMMKGNFNKVPSFLGFNSEESLLFLKRAEFTWPEVAAQFDVDPSLLIYPSINVENRTLVGKKLKEYYTISSFLRDLGAFIRFTSDAVFTRSTIRQAEITSEYVPTYLYQLSAAYYMNEKYPGVAHSYDLYYLWKMSDTIPVDEEIRDIVLRLWWNFIKYKNPTPVRDPALQKILWPTVGEDSIKYLNLNKTLSIDTNPRNYEDLKKILLKYMKSPFHVF